MGELGTQIIIHTIVGICVFVGFFIFFGKSNGWFKEGGLVYEWWKAKKAAKANAKRAAERAKRAEKRAKKAAKQDDGPINNR